MTVRPEVARAFRAGSSPSDEEADRFFAVRVGDYARLLGLVFTGLYVVGALFTWGIAPERFWDVHLHPSKWANLVFALGSLSIWRLVRRPGCPRWLVGVADAALPVGVASVFAGIAYTTPPGYGLHVLPLLLAALLLVLRAGLVPSTPRRTALVSALTSVPVLWACNVAALRDPVLMDRFANLSPGAARWPWFAVSIGVTMWCVALTLTTSYVSRVIYGLQREVQSARRLGQYVLGELIGEGGMGAVYHAQHALLRRPTAVKLLLPERVDSQSIARFEREVQITARLTHPNTVAIYDFGRTPDGVFYYAMEYLDGVSLSQLVERFGPQPAARVTHILLRAVGALAEAHALGLIHRDIKPANILLCQRGGVEDVVKLLDFGLVKRIGPAAEPELTQANAITGTPQFLAPESIADPTTVDHRVDLYGIGCVGYFLLTGAPPFEGKTVVEVCSHHLHSIPRKPSDRVDVAIDPELEGLVLSCLAKAPEERPRDAPTLEAALSAIALRLPWTTSDARAAWSHAERTAEKPRGHTSPRA